MTDQQTDDKRQRISVSGQSRGVAERPKGNPFGIVSVVKTPGEIFQELIDTRGLSPHQVRFALDGREAELVVGPFVIENPLGNGPLGECSLALQLNSGDRVSLRQLPISMNDDEQALASALQRAREVEHPGFQKPVRVGRHQGRSFIAHEFLPGEDLDRYVDRTGRLLPQQALDCIIQVTKVLHTAQRQGLIHGDLRPSKLIVNRQGTAFVREFATANYMRGRRQESANLASILALLPVRHVQCAAPEIFLPKAKIDFHADIYSLGCILHFLLTGKPVFAGSESGKVVVAHRSERVPSVASKLYGIPAPMDRLLIRLLAKSPGDRFNSYGDLLQAVQVVQNTLGKQGPDAAQSWWRTIDESLATSYQKPPTKLSRFKMSRLISLSAILITGVVLTVAAVMFWPQTPNAVPTRPAPVVETETTGTKPRIFDGRDQVPREVITVEADEVFRLP